jgi:intracellular septation protein
LPPSICDIGRLALTRKVLMSSLLYAARPLVTDFLGSIFFVILLALKVDVSVAAAAGVAISIAVIAVQMIRRLPVAPLQWLSIALVLVSGAATILTHDPRFVMAKPTIIYIAVGVVMLKRGWMQRYIPPIAAGHVDDVTIVFGYVWAAMMLLTAAANLVIAVFYTPYWVAFIGIFPLASKLALFAVQFIVSRRIGRRRIIAHRAALAASAEPA